MRWKTVVTGSPGFGIAVNYVLGLLVTSSRSHTLQVHRLATGRSIEFL
jgi:hypothetical protein